MFLVRCVLVLVYYLYVIVVCIYIELVVFYFFRVYYFIKNWYKLCRLLIVGSIVRGYISFILFYGYMLYVLELYKKYIIIYDM